MPPIIFLGNKKDLLDVNPAARQVSSEDVNAMMAECNNVISKNATAMGGAGAAAAGGGGGGESTEGSNWTTLHYETSALTGEKIDSIFDNMVREIRCRRKPSAADKKKSPSWCFLL